MALGLGDNPRAEIAAARAFLEQPLEPVPTDSARRAEWKAAMDDRLRRLAVKIAPGMAVEQGKIWREVMTDALSDLPAMVALTAAKRAIHRPMSFLNEVEAIVRQIAVEIHAERRRARERLADLFAVVQRPAQLALPPQDDGAPFSPDEIRKMSVEIRDMGVAGGWITQAEIDAAFADQDAAAA